MIQPKMTETSQRISSVSQCAKAHCLTDKAAPSALFEVGRHEEAKRDKSPFWMWINENENQDKNEIKNEVFDIENEVCETPKLAPSVHCIVGRKANVKLNFFEKLKPIETYKNEIKALFLLHENKALHFWLNAVELANKGVLSLICEEHTTGFFDILNADERKRFFRIVNAITILNKENRIDLSDNLFQSEVEDFKIAIEIYEYNRSLKIKYSKHLRLAYDLAKLCFEHDCFTKLMLVDILDLPFNYVHELSVLLEKQGKFICEKRNENQEKLYRIAL